MAFKQQQRSYPLQEKYDLQTISKHVKVCTNIRDQLVKDNNCSESLIRAELRFDILHDVVWKQQAISIAKDKLSEYRKTLEVLEHDTSNNLISEMEYLTKSKELLVPFKVVSAQIEKNKILLEKHLKKYLDTFKLQRVRIDKAGPIIHKHKPISFSSFNYDSDSDFEPDSD
jgi:hypothetical protein